MVERHTLEQEVQGSIPTTALKYLWARHFKLSKVLINTQEAVAPSQHDWKIVYRDNKQTKRLCLCSWTSLIGFVCMNKFTHAYAHFILFIERSRPANEPYHELFAYYVQSKMLISGNHAADQCLNVCYIDSVIYLFPKSEISSLYTFTVAIQHGLCRTWSETSQTGFLTMRLNWSVRLFWMRTTRISSG